MIIPNINFLYFYSTVSQTCAGVLAFIGVFIVFRLDKTYASINKYHYDIYSAMTFFGAGDYEKVIQKATEEVSRFNELRKTGGSIPQQTNGKIQEVDNLLKSYFHHTAIKAKIINSFFRPLCLGALTIALSVANIFCLSGQLDFDLLSMPSLLAIVTLLFFYLSIINSIFFVKESL